MQRKGNPLGSRRRGSAPGESEGEGGAGRGSCGSRIRTPDRLPMHRGKLRRLGWLREPCSYARRLRPISGDLAAALSAGRICPTARRTRMSSAAHTAEIPGSRTEAPPPAHWWSAVKSGSSPLTDRKRSFASGLVCERRSESASDERNGVLRFMRGEKACKACHQTLQPLRRA